MKKYLTAILASAMILSLAACQPAAPSAQENASSSQAQSESLPPPSVPEQSSSAEENPVPEEISEPTAGDTDQDEIYVADAAMYRGTVEEIEKAAEETLLTLRQAKGTNYGAASLKFRFTKDTMTSFDLETLEKGAYLDVYYGIDLGKEPDTAQIYDAIGANKKQPAEMVNFNGIIKEISPDPEVEGKGDLVMEDIENGQEVIFHYDGENTQFYLNFSDLKPGDKLNIYHRGVYTMSLPPQGGALEVQEYAEL